MQGLITSAYSKICQECSDTNNIVIRCGKYISDHVIQALRRLYYVQGLITSAYSKICQECSDTNNIVIRCGKYISDHVIL